MQDDLFQAQPEFRLDGRRLVDLLNRHRVLIAITTVLAPVAAFIYLSRQAPVYQAQASIVIESATPQYLGSNFRDVVDLENNWWSAQEYLQTQYRVLQSRSMAYDTSVALCREKLSDGTPVTEYLAHDKGCSTQPVDKDHRHENPVNQKATLVLMGRVEVSPQKDSRIVNLSMKDGNAQAAQIMVNTLAETYRQRNLERRIEHSEDATSWLKDEYGDLATQLNNAEQDLVRFKRDNHILSVALEDQQNEVSQRRRKIVDELTAVQLKLIALNSQREQYKNLRDSDVLKETAPQLQENPVIQKMKETYAQEYQKLVELRGKYLDKHPSVLAQEARLQAIRADIQNEARLSIKSLDAAYAATLKQERDLAAEQERTTQAGLHLEDKAIEFNRLRRNFERLQKLSEQVGGREKESDLARKLKTNNVSLLDRALLPESALKPNALLVGGVALVFGFLVGFGLAFLLDLLDSTVKAPEDIEERLKMPFLGMIPRIQGSDKDLPLTGPLELYIHGKPKSQVAECCRAIRTSLVFMSPDRPLRRILVTSGDPQEGKSTTAVNLAITLAQSGQRVLIVDTDMRRPRLHKIFKLATTAGFSSVVAGEAEAADVVRETVVKNLFVLPCGPIPPNPAELLHSDRCKAVVRELGERFDRVVFDSPPLRPVTDASILSQMCDGVVMVAKSNKTSRENLFQVRKQLVAIKANILGVVLNDLDLATRGGYGYRYYHYRYGQYYGEDTPSPPTAAASGGA